MGSITCLSCSVGNMAAPAFYSHITFFWLAIEVRAKKYPVLKATGYLSLR